MTTRAAPGSAALTSIGLAEQTFSLGDVSGAAGHLSGFHQTTGAMLGTVASTNDPDGWDKALSSLQSETPPISPPASSGWDDLLRQLRSTYTTTDWARVISGAPTPKLADVLPAITSTVPQGWQPTDWSLQQPSPQLSSIFSPVPEILGAHPPIGRDLVRSAEKMLGTPYVHGGKRPGGFDCSGLTQYACRQNGIAIGPDTYHQIKAGRPVRFDHAKPGDLVFFDTIGAFNHDPSHVGMVVGNGKMIVAPHTGDVVKYEQMNTPYWRQRLVGVRRVTPPAP